MNLDLSSFARFYSSTTDPFPKNVPYDYEIAKPWTSRSFQSGIRTWENATLENPSSSINCANTIYLRDSSGNNYPFVRNEEDVVEYIANFTTYSGGGGSCACIDFPAFGGTIEAITDIEFIGQGTVGGITAVNITREIVPLKTYFYGRQLIIGDEVTQHNPTFYPNTILTARNGVIWGGNKTFYIYWDYDSTLTGRAQIAFVPSKPIVTGVYVYWLSENNERHHYAMARYNNAQYPTSATPEKYAIYYINKYLLD